MMELQPEPKPQERVRFVLTQQEVTALNRVVEALLVAKDPRRQELIRDIGSIAAASWMESDLDPVYRLRDLISDREDAIVEYKVASAHGGKIPLENLGRAGETAKAVLEFSRKYIFLKAGKVLEVDIPSTIQGEIHAYWTCHSQQYLELIANAARELPPLGERCKASVCIPVADHEEGSHIYRTLAAFLNQSVDAEEFNLILFLNHPHYEDAARRVAPDHTRQEVERFQREHPELSVHFFQMEVPEKYATIGYVRKVVNDVALLRYFSAGRFEHDHILLRVDADTCGVHPEFIKCYLERFDRCPEIDSLKGRLDWDWPTLLHDPILLFGTRLYMALDAYIETTSEEVGGGGANFGVRASRYAAANGYHPAQTLGEDVCLGRQLRAKRECDSTHTAIATLGAKSRLWTSSRRGEVAVTAGKAPVLQWSEEVTLFDLCNPDIRKATAPQTGKGFLELLEAKEFQARLEAMIEQTVAFFASARPGQSPPALSEVVSRTFSLAIEMDEKGKVSVKEWKALKNWLEHFAREAPRYWSEKLQFE